MGKPELLMIGGPAVIKSINNLNLGTHYVNTFEVLSSSNGDVFIIIQYLILNYLIQVN